MSKVVETRDIAPSAWENLSRTSPVSTWFQTREAFEFYDSLPFLEAFVLGVENDGSLKGLVVGYVQKDGGVLKQFLSRRAVINGGPLLDDSIAKEDLTMLLEALKSKLKRKAIFIEMRNFNDYNPWHQFFEASGFAYEPHYDIWVDTSDMEVINEHLGKSRKRDIRVSLRDGATVETQPTMEQVRDYYLILSDLYKNKVKTPLFPLSFFEQLYRLPSSAFLLVEFEGKVIGGTVCVGLRDKALYEMFACGMDGVHKTIFPSELATFAGLQYAAEHDMPRFDMMGAGSPNDGGYGVRDFKLKFGGKLVELGRYIHVCNRLLFGIGKLGVKLMKKI